MTPQQQMIKNSLESGETLSPLDALIRFVCFKLATRIGELIRDYGMKIDKKLVFDNGKRFMTYHIKKEQ